MEAAEVEEVAAFVALEGFFGGFDGVAEAGAVQEAEVDYVGSGRFWEFAVGGGLTFSLGF